MNQKNGTRVEWLTTKRICAICKAMYTNQNSIGRHECREHPGIIRLGRWTCCKIPVSREILSAKLFYQQPFSLPLLGCVKCDHKETLEPYSMMPYIDYRVIRDRIDCSTMLVQTLLITRQRMFPADDAKGYEDTDYTEIFRYSRNDFKLLTS